jgi:hypothetical protein
MSDLTELDAKVREARGKSTTRLTITDDGCAIFGPNDTALDALISAVRAHERHRCRQAIAEMGHSLNGEDAYALHDALAAIDALEGP